MTKHSMFDKTTVKNAGFVWVLLTLILNASAVRAQTEHAEVRMVIDQLFRGMRSGDSALVSRAVLSTATLQTVMKDAKGEIKTEGGAIAGFIKAVGTPHQDVWDERIYEVVIQVDGPMATVWAPYQFYRGKEFSHCGVNAFTLIETAAGWKISAIIETRRKEACL